MVGERMSDKVYIISKLYIYIEYIQAIRIYTSYKKKIE